MTAVTNGADATGANFSVLASFPAGTQFAGYATGEDGVAWTAAQFARYPGTVVIDQDPAASGYTADVLDVENGTAAIGECALWAQKALFAFAYAQRPGQRSPAIYCSRDNATAVVNALIAGGITSGVGLWIADWDYSQPDAIAAVAASSGPFPVVGMQYSDQGAGGKCDLDVFLTSWLQDVSKEPVTPSVPPGQWLDPATWQWAECAILGTGLDGKLHLFQYDTATETWVKVALCSSSGVSPGSSPSDCVTSPTMSRAPSPHRPRRSRCPR